MVGKYFFGIIVMTSRFILWTEFEDRILNSGGPNCKDSCYQSSGMIGCWDGFSHGTQGSRSQTGLTSRWAADKRVDVFTVVIAIVPFDVVAASRSSVICCSGVQLIRMERVVWGGRRRLRWGRSCRTGYFVTSYGSSICHLLILPLGEEVLPSFDYVLENWRQAAVKKICIHRIVDKQVHTSIRQCPKPRWEKDGNYPWWYSALTLQACYFSEAFIRELEDSIANRTRKVIVHHHT